ncbi:hypothetical protein WN55_06165 [Dufourea novaeangliae]|uniref:Uncharacterized protein n=1 Tax=Dufourea novaeangliae TaxID=178035 RepID=A0A154P4E3_DUFNO|nr:hypothetical protein WN55_06165 [Dufourea novaeangliae]
MNGNGVLNDRHRMNIFGRERTADTKILGQNSNNDKKAAGVIRVTINRIEGNIHRERHVTVSSDTE